MALWQWLGLAVAAAALCMAVRALHPQLAGLCAVAAGCVLLISLLEQFQGLQALLARLTALGGVREEALQTLLKTLGMSYATELAAQACVDLGETGLAKKAELAGKLCVFAVAAPMLLSLLEMILELAP